jgi:hypothetical protein
MENWLDKYKPKQLSDVIGNKSEVDRVDKFVKQFTKKTLDIDKIPNANLIITGTNGIGKTITVDLVLANNGITKVTADLSNISITRKSKKKKKVEKEPNGSTRTIKTYYMSLQNKHNLLLIGELEKKKIALVIDDVSNISNPKEKEAIKSLVKLNNKLKQFPIIIIANTKHSKTVNELRKMVTYTIKKTDDEGKKESRKVINEILFRAPDHRAMDEFTRKICKAEKLKIITNKNDDEDLYIMIIQHAQYDIRRLVNILEELKMIYQDEDITYDKVLKYAETSKTKDMDPGIYEATRLLLNQYKGIDYALSLYGEERATVPLMVHENYPLNIRQQYPNMSTKDQIEIMFQISKCISESDNVDGLIYSNQCWSLQPVHGFYSCVMPSYYINKYPNKLTSVEKYEYTKDYNKTSIKKINNKVIKKAQENPFLKKVSIYDFLYIASILKTLFARKDFDMVGELLKPYGLTPGEIESIIKIDKVRKTKNNLTGKQKSIIKEKMDQEEVEI